MGLGGGRELAWIDSDYRREEGIEHRGRSGRLPSRHLGFVSSTRWRPVVARPFALASRVDSEPDIGLSPTHTANSDLAEDRSLDSALPRSGSTASHIYMSFVRMVLQHVLNNERI